jgi:hypothetical protein
MLNKLNAAHADQKAFFQHQLDLVSDDWADVSYKHDECPSISNGTCTIYFGLCDLSDHYPFVSAVFDDDQNDLGDFETIQKAINHCEKLGE